MSEDLQALEAQAAAIDAEAAAPDVAAAEPEAVRVDLAAELAALLQTAAGILVPAFPCLATIYTEATCKRLGDAAAPVMDKYGWSVGGLFDRWGAEITLAAVALPVALATAQGVKADLAAKRKPPEPEPNPPAPPTDAVNQSAYAEERTA